MCRARSNLPLAAKLLARTHCYHGIIALGAVVRGETPHFDYVARNAARGLQQVALETGVPVAFGVLTTDTMEQAEARAGGTSRQQRFRRRDDRDRNGAFRESPRRCADLMPARHRSRQRALQVLFLWDQRKQAIDEAILRSTYSIDETARVRRRRAAAAPRPTNSWRRWCAGRLKMRATSISASPRNPSTGAWSACPPSTATSCVSPSTR